LPIFIKNQRKQQTGGKNEKENKWFKVYQIKEREVLNTESSTLKKENRHISALAPPPIENKPNFQHKKFSIHAFILTILFLSLAGAMRDLGVFLIDIPPFNQLQINTVRVWFNLVPAFRSGEPLMLTNKFETTRFVCTISSSGRNACIEENKRKYIEGKKGKVWWYKTGVNEFFSSNVLLQLEVDGEVIIGYETQKKEYLRYKKNYIYIDTAIFLVTLLIYLIFMIYNRNNK
jgi:hypothetical protein